MAVKIISKVLEEPDRKNEQVNLTQHMSITVAFLENKVNNVKEFLDKKL